MAYYSMRYTRLYGRRLNLFMDLMKKIINEPDASKHPKWFVPTRCFVQNFESYLKSKPRGKRIKDYGMGIRNWVMSVLPIWDNTYSFYVFNKDNPDDFAREVASGTLYNNELRRAVIDRFKPLDTVFHTGMYENDNEGINNYMKLVQSYIAKGSSALWFKWDANLESNYVNYVKNKYKMRFSHSYSDMTMAIAFRLKDYSKPESYELFHEDEDHYFYELENGLYYKNKKVLKFIKNWFPLGDPRKYKSRSIPGNCTFDLKQ